MKLLLIAIFLTGQFSYAECPENVQLIREGEVANCTGFLYSPKADEAANDLYDEHQHLKTENELLTKKNTLTEQQNIILEKRLKLYMDESNILAKRLVEKENRSELRKIIYFSLGVLATSLAVHGAKRF